jgi:hypothetical protein
MIFAPGVLIPRNAPRSLSEFGDLGLSSTVVAEEITADEVFRETAALTLFNLDSTT